MQTQHGEQARSHQTQDFIYSRVFQSQARQPAESIVEERRDLHTQVQQRAQDHTIDHTVNTETRGQHQDAENLAEIVHGGRHGRSEKMLVGLQAGHHQAAERKDQDGDQVEPHQAGGESPTRFIGKSRCNHVADQRVCEEHDNQRDGRRDCEGQVQDAGKKHPGLPASRFVQGLSQDRDQRDAERTARDQGRKQVGNIVRDEKDIALNRLELAVEQNLAQQAQDFINAEKECNNQGGTGDG